MNDSFLEARRTLPPVHGAVHHTGPWKMFVFMLLLGVTMLASVPSVNAGSPSILEEPKLGQALGQILNIVINQCAKQTELWEQVLATIVKVKSEEYPDWSVAVVRNGQRLSEEGTCSMEAKSIALCGIHEVTIFWGKHDRKCWFRNNGDGGWNNWHMYGLWERSDNGNGKEAWIGY
jgi:hypothetical protein